MKASRVMDRICALLFFAAGLFIFLCVPLYVTKARFDPVGSRFFPYAIAVLMMALSVLMFVRTFVGSRYRVLDKTDKNFRINLRDNGRAVLFCVVLVISVYLIQNVHFLVGSLLLMVLMLLICKVKKPLWYVIVCTCTAVIYVVFSQLLGVRI